MSWNSFMLMNIKILDIGALGVYYFLGSIIFVTVFNNFFRMLYETDKNKIKDVSTSTLLIQTCIQSSVILIVSFYLRHFVRNIPFPFEGMYNYKHSMTKEINGGIVLSFAMITAFSDFNERAVELASRFKI